MINIDVIEVNGKRVEIKPTKSRFQRTAYQLSQDIYRALERVGITKDYIDLPMCRNPLKRDEPAMISWTVNGKDYYFECSKQERFVDNLGVIAKVIEQESYAIRNGLKPFGMAMNQFRLGYDPDGKMKRSPREILGVPEYVKDAEYIKFRYKQKARELHPDQGGDPEKFKELQEAYEELRKEMKRA